MAAVSDKNVKFVEITPETATKMLEDHELVVRKSGLQSLNRIINDNTVTQYANDMKNKKWIENGESIKRTESKRLLDGQHRLWACANSGASFRTLLVDNISDGDADKVFVTTDIGRTKIPSAFLGASGVGYSGIVAPAIRLIISYKKFKTLTKAHMITTPEVVEYGTKHAAKLMDSAAFVAKNQSYAPTSTLAAWHYLMSEKSPEDAASFITDLKHGIGLTKGDPVYAMRERLIQNKASRTQKLQSKVVFALGLYMWNDRRKGVSRQVIKNTQLSYSELPTLV